MSAQRSRRHGRRHKSMPANVVSLSRRAGQMKGCLSEEMKICYWMCLYRMVSFAAFLFFLLLSSSVKQLKMNPGKQNAPFMRKVDVILNTYNI